MPYCGGDLAMVLLLPDQADGIGAVEARLSPEVLETSLDALVHTRVVSLPKFQLEPEALALGDALSAMGMPLAIDAARADFTGIANPPSSRERIHHLSAVCHRAFVKVDEKGTEAAAATSVVMGIRGIAVSATTPEFKADHPFLFPFMGRVSNPGQAGGRPCSLWRRRPGPRRRSTPLTLDAVPAEVARRCLRRSASSASRGPLGRRDLPDAASRRGQPQQHPPPHHRCWWQRAPASPASARGRIASRGRGGIDRRRGEKMTGAPRWRTLYPWSTPFGRLLARSGP
jgi:hypothetical protein